MKKLEDADLAPDEIVFAGREIYILYANGVGRRTRQAARPREARRRGHRPNWNTVTKLLEMADERR